MRSIKRGLGYIETCSECGGDVRIVASIEDPAVIQKILAHLDNKGQVLQRQYYCRIAGLRRACR